MPAVTTRLGSSRLRPAHVDTHNTTSLPYSTSTDGNPPLSPPAFSLPARHARPRPPTTFANLSYLGPLPPTSHHHHLLSVNSVPLWRPPLPDRSSRRRNRDPSPSTLLHRRPSPLRPPPPSPCPALTHHPLRLVLRDRRRSSGSLVPRPFLAPGVSSSGTRAAGVQGIHKGADEAR